MASIRYRKSRKRWEVRRSVKDPLTGKTHHYCRLLPPNCTREKAKILADHFDQQARQIRMTRFNSAASIKIAGQAYLEAWKTHPPESYRVYSATLTAFFQSLPPDIIDVTQITPLHISTFINSVVAAGLKARTANIRLTAIKSFCRWCSKMYRIANPAAAVSSLHELPPDRRFLSEPEYHLILSACTPMVRNRLEFIGNTGLRASELCNLKWHNISPDRQYVHLYGKATKHRVIPLNAICRDILDRQTPQSPQPDSRIFLSKSTHPLPDQRLTRVGLYQTCVKIADRLNLAHFGPHAFRHYFATKMILSNTPLKIVSQILGHASTKTTEHIYCHICPPNLIGATDCLVRKSQ